MAIQVVPVSQLPAARPLRVILHFSAGKYQFNSTDAAHYHFGVQGDLRIKPGVHKISDNESTSDGRYAAHTRGCNTRSIGIAACGMFGATERDLGRYPITSEQLSMLCKLAAQLCDHYRIPVTPKTVLTHAEVQTNLGIRQNGKWDYTVLPGKGWVGAKKAGDHIRRLVDLYMHTSVPAGAAPPVLPDLTSQWVQVRLVQGAEAALMDGLLDDGSSWVQINQLLQALPGRKIKAVRGEAILDFQEFGRAVLDMKIYDGHGYVQARQLASVLGAEISYSALTQTVTLELPY